MNWIDDKNIVLYGDGLAHVHENREMAHGKIWNIEVEIDDFQVLALGEPLRFTVWVCEMCGSIVSFSSPQRSRKQKAKVRAGTKEGGSGNELA